MTMGCCTFVDELLTVLRFPGWTLDLSSSVSFSLHVVLSVAIHIFGV